MRRSQRGLSLVELLIASVLAVSLFGVASYLLLGAVQLFAAQVVVGKTHAEFLTMREQLARDSQQASRVVERIALDGQRYETVIGPEANTLVLQLPAVGASDSVLPGVYDYVVYTIQPAARGVVSLHRQAFTNRDANGNQQSAETASVRLPETRVLVQEVANPQSTGVPLFAFDRPVVSVAQEVLLTITAQTTESTQTHHTFPQTYTARFRLRNL